MAVEVKLPRLGQGMEAGTIVRWLKSEGEKVAKGEPLYELDTDKVTQEVEAEADGVLLKILVPDGETDVGTTVAVIGAEGEEVSVETPPEPTPESPVQAEAPPAQAPDREAKGEEAGKPSDKVSQGDSGAAAVAEAPAEAAAEAPAPEDAEAPAPEDAARSGRVKASPLARRIARERGIELSTITGTGPDGRIVAEDVERAETAPRAAPAGAPPAAPGEVEVVQLTSVRRTIARRLTEAWEAPVFQLTVTADASELVATREQMLGLVEEGGVKPTVNDVLTRLVASALMRHRAVNANFVEGEIHRFPSANIGIAVATPNGLIVPVLRDADRRSVQEIATARADLVGRARDGKLQLSDLEGGTFTISNLGMYGIDQFIAVLNPPQVAILAVGAIADRPVVAEGALEIAPTMTLTLTCDHRAIDGSEGAEFLRTVKTLVEAPALAL
jgi:pyruvate dehydrogenase E2 component (dihydrolipoamide acetyltransferase)